MIEEKKSAEEKKAATLSEMDALKAQYRANKQRAEQRIAVLERSIPQLEKEKDQLIGMVIIMNDLIGEEEGMQNEPKGNGSKPDGT